jgi:hypothetical protein
MTNETTEQRESREKKSTMDNFKVMGKEEFQAQLAKGDFMEFLNKTSRIVERALDNEFDVVGDFFKDDDEENQLKLR